MKHSFKIPLKFKSINDLHYANRSHGKKQSTKEWECEAFHYLHNDKILEKLKKLREYYVPEKHFYEVWLTHYIPYDKLFTKKDGKLKTPDLSNIEKPVIDLIFLPTYFKPKPPFGVENLNIDDKYIADLHSSKRPSSDDEYYLEVKIAIKDLDLIKQI